MDFLFNSSLIDPTNDHSLLAFQAQQLLRQIDWTYYTIWREATTHNLQGLAWSRGGVNELLVADQCGNMGLLLQEFYKHCSFLPLDFGMAGETFESRQYRWASGEELLLQISFLSIQNQQAPPPELQALYFKTVVYIPLEKGAGVLEIGTKELVPKSESGVIFKIVGFMINGLNATQGSSRGDEIMSSSFEAGTAKALANDGGNQYGDPDEQYRSCTSMMEMDDGGRAIIGHPSITSPYWSCTSTKSASTPSTSDQMGNNSNTTFASSSSGLGRQQDIDQYIVSSFTNNGTPHEMISPAQVHHMHAELKRRRKQKDCINTLRTLLPNITENGKVAILESTIRQLKELKNRKCELEQENSALMNLRKSSKDSIGSQENAMWYYGEHTMPHFRLIISIKNVQDVNVNATVIEIMNALQKKNLYCYEINSEFWKDTSKLYIKILATYKEGENYSPTLDEIQTLDEFLEGHDQTFY